MTPDEMAGVAMTRGTALRRRRLAVRSGAVGVVLAAFTVPAVLLLGPSHPTRQTIAPAPTPTATLVSSEAPASPTPTPSSSDVTTTGPAPASCSGDALAASWGGRQGAGGNDAQQILFTNTSASACVLQGTAAVQVVGGTGQQPTRAAVPGEQLGTGLAHAATEEPVTLPAGGRAGTWVYYSGNAPGCQGPVTVTVTAPGTSRALVLPPGVTVCDPVVEAVTPSGYQPEDMGTPSSTPSSTPPSSTPVAPTPSPTGAPTCDVAALTGVWAADAGAGAGMVSSRIVVTNEGPGTCSLQGVPHVEYAGDDGRRLVSEGHDGIAPEVVVLPPGGTARTSLTSRDVDDFGGGCAGRAGHFELTLPGSTAPLLVGVDDGPDLCGPLGNSSFAP